MGQHCANTDFSCSDINISNASIFLYSKLTTISNITYSFDATKISHSNVIVTAFSLSDFSLYGNHRNSDTHILNVRLCNDKTLRSLFLYKETAILRVFLNHKYIFMESKAGFSLKCFIQLLTFASKRRNLHIYLLILSEWFSPSTCSRVKDYKNWDNVMLKCVLMYFETFARLYNLHIYACN